MTTLLAVLALATMNVRVAFHVHSTFSDGRHTVEELASRAAERGIDAIVLSDHFLTEIQYGPPIFRESLAFTLRPPALGPGDLEVYVERAREVERRTGVLILPGVELTPFYFWRGSLLEGTLTLHSAHRHLVVVFPEEPDTKRWGESLVSAGAPASKVYRWASLGFFWPLVPLGWAIFRLRHPTFVTVRTGSFVLRSPRGRAFPCVILLTSSALLARVWPFECLRFDPYGEDPGAAPYQVAIDQARAAGGLAVWAHPEIATSFHHAHYPVSYRSDAYPQFIVDTEGAVGFASLYEGFRQAAAPGGFWDEALEAFARGERAEPTWAFGELDLHEEGEAGGKFLGEVETILRVEERSRRSVLEALARGAGYAVYQEKSSRLVLESFTVTCGSRKARMGEQLRASEGQLCTADMRLRREGEVSRQAVEILLLRNGAPCEKALLAAGANAVVEQWPLSVAPAEKAIFRLVATSGPRTVLHANPIFVLGTRGAS